MDKQIPLTLNLTLERFGDEYEVAIAYVKVIVYVNVHKCECEGK